MDNLDRFMMAEKARLEGVPVPARYDDVLEGALLEAGLTEADVKDIRVSREAAGYMEMPTGEGDKGAGEPKRAKGSKRAKEPKNANEPKRRKRRLYWIPAVAACVAVIIAVSSFLPSAIQESRVPQALPESFKGIVSVRPLLGADDQMDPAGGFLITSTEALPVELVVKALVIEPAIEYTLNPRKGGTEYEVLPLEPLDENKVYQIAFDPGNSLADLAPRGSHTWAFQTKGEFGLQGTLPRSNTSMVPVSTTFELWFTAPPDLASVEREVGLTPYVPGHWIVEGSKAIYLPERLLDYKTVYEIHVPKGVREAGGQGATGDSLTVVFHTEGEPETASDGAYFSILGQNLSFRTDEAPFVQFYFNDWDRRESDPLPEVRADIYAYPDGESYLLDLTEKIKNIDWLYSDEDVWLPAETLAPVESLDLTGHKPEYSWYLYFPEALPKGCYLAEFTMGRQRRQLLFQVTDLSAYLSVSEEEALIWVNDLRTGQGAGGAEVTVNGELSATADSDGVAFMGPLPQAKVRAFDVRYGGERLLLADTSVTYSNPDMLKWMEQRKTAQSYWNYLYVDKPIYRPEDTIHFFGLIAPRTASAAAVRDVTLRLEYYRANMNIKQTCAVVDDVLLGSFVLPVLTPGYYNLSMYLDDAFICSTYFEVAVYEKPAYRITLGADKKVAMMGDVVRWTAAAAFFDGTPLAGQLISFSGSAIDGDQSAVSDMSGEVRFDTKAGGSFNYLVNTDYVYANAALPEIGDIYRDGRITVFASDIELTGKAARMEPGAAEAAPSVEAPPTGIAPAETAPAETTPAQTAPAGQAPGEGAREDEAAQEAPLGQEAAPSADGDAEREEPPEGASGEAAPSEEDEEDAEGAGDAAPGDAAGDASAGGDAASAAPQEPAAQPEPPPAAPSDTVAPQEGSEAHSLFTISLEAFDVDISRITDPDGNLTEQALALYGGFIEVEASLIREHWYKVETGQRYDPYTKQMSPVYDYRMEEIPEDTFYWTYARDGDTRFTEKLYSADGYQLILTFRDRAGRQVIRTFYLPRAEWAAWDNYNSGYNWYWLRQDDDKYFCSIGEEATFRLNGWEGVVASSGRYLFFRAREHIIDYRMSAENEYTFRFGESELPGSNVMAVFFDGSRYCPANYPAGARMDPEDRALRAEITTDKERYKPGETVSMEIRLTDKDGRPVKGVINLNLVDEALLAVRDQWIDPGHSVFLGNLYDFPYRATISHPSSNGGNMAEGGEGDGGRDDFRDTVLFRLLYTDNEGRISISFDLPDNITTWRVIWQAYAPDIWVGGGAAALPVGLPFFNDVRFSEIILESDEPVLGVRSAGSAITQSAPSQISWTVSIPELGITQEMTGQAYSWMDIPLPAMQEGRYTLQVDGAWEGYRDTVRQPFSVVKSRQNHTAREEAVLTEGFRPPGSETGMTTLVFSDKARNLAMGGLTQLAGQESIRVEQRLAALEAGKLLKNQFRLDWWSQSEEEERQSRGQILRYQSYDGGVAFLPYGDADLYTSVWAASAGLEYFSREDLALYFNEILDNGEYSWDKTMALWGAAACRRPVLPEIRQALKEDSWRGAALSGQEKLNLICALIFLGGGNEALEPAQALLQEWTEGIDGLYRATIGGDRTETLKATAQMAVVAAVLDLPQAEGLYQYILENPSEEEYFLLEKLICLRAACSKLTDAASFIYTLEGEEVTVDLSRQPSYNLLLTPEQRSSISINQVDGGIIAESQYRKDGLAAPAATAAGQLQISRSYRVDDQDSRSLSAAGRTQVMLTYRIEADAPDGCYNIVDYLPAGLRFVSLDTQGSYGSQRHWLLQEDGNKLTFGIYKSREAVEGRLFYTVRTAMPGSFLAEPAVLAHSGLQSLYVTTEGARVYIN